MNIIDTNIIICGDFKEILKDWSNNCIDMIFVDPPYGKAGIPIYEDIAKERVNYE